MQEIETPLVISKATREEVFAIYGEPISKTYAPFSGEKEYMRNLLDFNAPLHKQAMALNAKRAVGKQKVQYIDHQIETNLADEFERYV